MDSLNLWSMYGCKHKTFENQKKHTTVPDTRYSAENKEKITTTGRTFVEERKVTDKVGTI